MVESITDGPHFPLLTPSSPVLPSKAFTALLSVFLGYMYMHINYWVNIFSPLLSL